MSVSSSVSPSTSDSSLSVAVQTGGQETSEQQVLKLLESVAEDARQTQQVTAQKTGLGSKLNISG